MVLRKPYAFFIKHFKLIHLILAILSIYATTQTYKLLSFFNDYIYKTVSVVGQDLIGTLYTSFMTFGPILIIILTITIMVIMIIKEKPYTFYIINILIFIFALVIFQINQSTLYDMQISLLDIRKIRIVRDLTLVSFILQIFSSIIIGIRGTGFDVKKFDFVKDLQELEINEEDREEFEVDFSVDKNKTQRKLKYQIRKLKYIFKENRLTFLVVTLFILLVSGFLVYNYIRTRPRVLNQGEIFTGNGLSLSIENSYLTKKDYTGKDIEDDFSFLVLQLKVINLNKNKNDIPFASSKIVIGNYSYTPTLEYKEYLFDFGNIYQNEVISEEYTYQTLVYKIPTLLTDEEIMFNYVNKVNSNEKFFKNKVRINYINIDEQTDKKTYQLGEEINFENLPFKNYKIKIDSYEIKSKFKLEYDYCYKNECIKSYEYVKPSLTSNYDKTLLKLNGTYNLTDEVNIEGIFDLFDLIEKFGYLKYELNNETKTQNVKFKEVTSNKLKEKNTYYVEVLKEVEKASKISLIIKIRNQTYEYVLK